MNKTYAVISAILLILCALSLAAQNAEKISTKTENKQTNLGKLFLIETNKKVFFDIDWKTWFIIRGTKDKPLRMRLFGNQPVGQRGVYINSSSREVRLNKLDVPSKSKLRYKTIVDFPTSTSLLNSEIYVRDSTGIVSNKIPVEIAYRRFSSLRGEFEGLRQNVDFVRTTDGSSVNASIAMYSFALNVHIIDLGIGVAGISAQYRIGKSFANTSSEAAIADFDRKNSVGYFFKLKPIRIRRLLLAPYYSRRFYTDEYSFRGNDLVGNNTHEIRTQEDQFGIQAFLLFKNKKKDKHEMLIVKAFYQYADQINTTDFRLVDKAGFGVTLYYSFWLVNESI